MSDKDWLLNPSAIKAAKACILIVQGELGIKLTLSHPEFLEMLKDYVELTGSDELESAYHRLVDYAGTSAHHFKAGESITPEPKKTRIRHQANTELTTLEDDDYVVYKGKKYKRFLNGKEFKGLYRGQARYD